MEFNYILKGILQKTAVILCFVVFIHADLHVVIDTCCEKGTEWAREDSKCDNYPGVGDIDSRYQRLCRTTLEVCCLKSKQEMMCEMGKKDAKVHSMCAIRDDVLAAVTYRECCSCCQMGLTAREMGMECNAPPIGIPCDLKFMECCTGITDPPPDSGEYENVTEPADMDECSVFEGQLCSHICINTIGSYRCDCPRGLTLAQDQSTCIEQADTCESNNECNQDCVNTNSGPRCTCREGYRLLGDRKTCRDIDECRRRMHNCKSEERCVNTEGGFQCRPRDEQVPTCRVGYIYNRARRACVPQDGGQGSCRSGFAYNTLTQRCEDIDECVVNLHNCYGQFEICENMYGNFQCVCEEGFMRNRRGLCKDIDECARQMDTCTSSQRCENTEGSFVCRRLTGCGTGYTLDEGTQSCIDQDECEAGTHNCGRGYECVNIEGSFRCIPRSCPEGFSMNSASGQCERMNCPAGLKPGSSSICVDIDECTERPGICQRYQTCVNSYGSYRCIDPVDCRPGYELDQNGQQCIDVDECARGTHDCSGGSKCINRQGSFLCTCPEGFRRINGVCQDKDECQYGNVCPFNSVCENTVGSYRCACNPGLEKRGRECVDIDECLEVTRCQHRCVNVVGSFHCACDTGYQLAADKRSCEDVDECRQFAGRGSICVGNCINTEGSYRCDCPEGWRLLGNGRSCQDIDECAEGQSRCGSNPDIMCFNTRGSHKCPRVTCPPGFTRSQLGPRGNSVRCRRISFTCRQGDEECLNAPLSLSYNFLSFPTNVKVPTDLFSMSGPQTAEKYFDWSLNVTSVYPAHSGITPVNRNYFDLKINRNEAVVALQDRIKGAQDIELLLSMKITDRYTGYTGNALSRIYLYVTSQNIRTY